MLPFDDFIINDVFIIMVCLCMRHGTSLIQFVVSTYVINESEILLHKDGHDNIFLTEDCNTDFDHMNMQSN